MEDVIEQVAGGHVTAVKIVLTSVVTALALYQVLLMAVVYGKARPPGLQPDVAADVHRAVGDVIVVVIVVVGLACLAVYGIEDSVEAGTPGPEHRAAWHVAASFSLAGVLALKLLVLHRWQRLSRLLPLLGVTVLALLVATWLTSAGAFLVG